MLRMQLKRFIIICTRIAREHFSVGADREKLFDTVRRYYVLVDEHFRTKKRVQDYAGLLHRSPKTLANLFASCGQPSPLNIIHDRVNAEARRLLLYTPKSAKEIAYLLGYEDTAAFSVLRQMTARASPGSGSAKKGNNSNISRHSCHRMSDPESRPLHHRTINEKRI